MLMMAIFSQICNAQLNASAVVTCRTQYSRCPRGRRCDEKAEGLKLYNLIVLFKPFNFSFPASLLFLCCFPWGR
jgi:hypothetical protein